MRRFFYLLLFALVFWISYKHLRPVVHAQTTCATDQTLGWHDCGSASRLVVAGVNPNFICVDQTGAITNGYACAGNGNGAIYANSGAIFDTTRNRMVIWGGGHGDYAGNEQYVIPLPADGSTPIMKRLTDKSAMTCVGLPSAYSCDGGVTPDARHTYNSIVYDPIHDAMFAWTGGLSPGCGPGSPCAVDDFWMYFYSGNAHNGSPHWEYLNPTLTCVGACTGNIPGTTWEPNNLTGVVPVPGLGTNVAYDSNTSTLWFTDQYGSTWNLNYDTKKITQINTSEGGYGQPNCQPTSSHGASMVDTVRKRLWITCGNQLSYISTASITPNSASWIVPPLASGNTNIFFGLSGMAYVTKATSPFYSHIVMWNGGNNVYDFNPDTNNITTYTYSGGPPAGKAEADGQVYGRWAYSPTLDAFTINNGGLVDQFVFRLNSSTPDTTPPSDPTSLTATAISSSQINLAWTASTDNVSVAGYNVERCAGAGCSNFAQITSVSTNSFADSGLTPSTFYSYRVRTFDTSNNLSSSYSNTATTSTQAPDVIAPTAPSSLTATAVSSSQVNLSWSASTDAVGVTRYRVERCSGGGCSSFVEITQINGAPPVTTYQDQGLTGSTSYSYRVRANDIAGNLSSYSNTSTATTQMAPPTTTLVDFLGNTNGAGAAHTDTYGLAGWTTTFMDFYADEFTRSGVSGATEYYTGTQRYNYQGVQTSTSPRTFVPGDIITATWFNNDVVPITLNPLVSFTCNSRSFLCAPWFPMTPLTLAAGATGTTTYTVDGTSTGTYSLVNVASEAAGQQVLILDKIVLSPSGSTDVIAPSIPAALLATAISTSEIDLSWSASTDATGVTSYLIERCTGGGCGVFTQIGTVNGAPPVTTFANTGLTPSTSYTYRIRASDAAGNLSAYATSSTASTLTSSDTIPPTAPTNLICTIISYRQEDCHWTASTDNVAVTAYLVEQCTGVGCVNFSIAGTVTGTPPATIFSSYILPSGTSVSTRIKALDGTGNISTPSNTATAITQSTNILQVGNNKQYTLLDTAITASNSGDRIEVDYNTATLPNTAQNIGKCIAIAGVGPPGVQASFPWDGGSFNHTIANGGTGTNPIPNDQAVFRIFATCVDPQLVTLENIEVSGAYGVSGNTGAVRYANTTSVRLTNVYFHDNEVGILGGNSQTDTYTTLIENSTINHNGADDGAEHNIYIGQQSHFILRYSKISNAVGGHDVKSRARWNEVYANFITSQTGSEGSSESPVDFPCGGDTYFIGNIVEQGVNSSFHGILQSGEEALIAQNCAGSFNPTNRIYINFNTIFNYFSGGNFFDVKTAGGPTPVFQVQNNILANGGMLYAGASPTLATNNNTIATSADFVSSATGNYHLVMGASEINAGVTLGVANGVSLMPASIYVDPANSASRFTAGSQPDVGAYEFGSVTPQNTSSRIRFKH